MGLRSGLCNGQGITVISLHSNQTIVPLAILLQRPADQLYIRCCIQPALNHLQSPNSTCQHAPPHLDFSSLCLNCRHNTVRMVLFFLPSFYEHSSARNELKSWHVRDHHTHTHHCLFVQSFLSLHQARRLAWCYGVRRGFLAALSLPWCVPECVTIKRPFHWEDAVFLDNANISNLHAPHTSLNAPE